MAERKKASQKSRALLLEALYPGAAGARSAELSEDQLFFDAALALGACQEKINGLSAVLSNIAFMLTGDPNQDPQLAVMESHCEISYARSEIAALALAEDKLRSALRFMVKKYDEGLFDQLDQSDAMGLVTEALYQKPDTFVKELRERIDALLAHPEIRSVAGQIKERALQEGVPDVLEQLRSLLPKLPEESGQA